ncbi:SDR family NAD(P)-dependent oxidoreductase [Cellvibrio sp. QJXJ]|uniref:SDR family NAD(P)-dependent oxidoreductase n=1 Tax=Cellvibrio sp. QJXJ TaxID=2964606 RepID=UPI0021C3597E|nr:SDR family NAD(P)-dependent oxidoreductase [Cellvibrio sp. QJXJ]UUA73395.1 SDR family NAD(P)-dependent oxidoreductase [Cellvibrio sp. QJXJ]
MNSNNSSVIDEIAIVGMAGRFPGANSVNELWENLCAGKEAIRFFSDEELRKAGVSEEDINNPNYVKAAPILDDIDLFDADFFQYSPREAQALDPQQRIFLETAWEALENGGYTQSEGASIGMFAGSGGVVTSYLLAYLEQHPEVKGMTGGFQHLGNDKDFLSTRASYKLDLKGPSVGIQTACSTSLVAVHMACQSILNGECDMALAGGINIRVPHVAGYHRQDGDIFSPDGHCRAFDAKADGIVFGSGVGLVLLKRLEDAKADNDLIYAVIKASAINNDGGKKLSYTASSQSGQVRCIEDVFSVAGVSADSIGYIEAHGTGTAMGDPVEISALTQVFTKQTQRKQFCGIGSVKSNLGHLDTASGITSLIKTALALHHKRIPPSINYTTPNPKINFEQSPFYVVDKETSWPEVDGPNRAGVNSLGIGGTNAFVLLEEFSAETQPIEKAKTNSDAQPYIIALSAKSNNALIERVRDLQQFIAYNKVDLVLQNLSYTLLCRRSHFSCRQIFVVTSIEDLEQQLVQCLNTPKNPSLENSADCSQYEPNALIALAVELKKSESEDYTRSLVELSKCYLSGHQVSWRKLFAGETAQLVALPNYPFQRQRYWVDTSINIESKSNNKASAIINVAPRWGGERVRSPIFSDKLVFESTLSVESFPFLADHLFDETPMVAASALISLILDVIKEHLDGDYTLDQVAFSEAFYLPESENRKVQLLLTPEKEGEYGFQISYFDDLLENDANGWRTPLTGKLVPALSQLSATASSAHVESNTLDEIIDVEDFYSQLADRSLHMGVSYKRLTSLQRGELVALGELGCSAEVRDSEPFAYNYHPGTLDALFQLMQLLVIKDLDENQISLLIGWESLQCFQPCPTKGYYSVKLRSRGALTVADIYLVDEQGALALKVEAAKIQSVARDRIPTHEPARFSRWKHIFDWVPVQSLPVDTSSAKSGHWVIFSDNNGHGDKLQRMMESAGHSVSSVYVQRSPVEDNNYLVHRPDAVEEYHSIFQDISIKHESKINGVIYLWGLNGTAVTQTHVGSLAGDKAVLCGGLLHITQALGKANIPMWIITQGAVSIGNENARLNPIQGMLWGMGRTLPMEKPQADCCLVDTDPAAIVNVSTIFQEIFSGGDEDQVAYRQGARFAGRLRSFSDVQKKPAKQLKVPRDAFDIGFGARGDLQSIEFLSTERVQPNSGEVEIDVDYSGISYRDLLVGQGVLPRNSTLGDDGVGTVVAVGVDVADINVGDKVMFLHQGSWRSHITVPSERVSTIPHGITDEEAATIPLVYLTAFYSLHLLGKLKQTDTILIHSAASGVGLAAVNLALAAGATVYATVSSTEKETYLRSLGVEHIFNSRSHHFVSEIRYLLGDKPGVDIVLSGLSGLLAEESYRLLAPTGSYVDLSRVLPETAIQQDGADYHAVNLYNLMDGDEPNVVISEMYQRIYALLVQGKIKPLPSKCYSLSQAITALDDFSKVAHIGKRIFAFKHNSDRRIKNNASYLIVGAFGALGPYLLNWLVDQGAQHVILTDVIEPPLFAMEQIKKLQAKGVYIEWQKANVSNAEEAQTLLVKITASMPALRGVFHCAAIIDDEPMATQQWDNFERILTPKVEGSWNLHVYTQGLSLDHFVMFSSIASLMGSANQGNYAAANAYQDSLAHYRQRCGMSALAINWSPWTVGIGAAMGERAAEVWKSWGSSTLNPERDVSILSSLILQELPQVAVLSIDWPTFTRQYTEVPRFLIDLADKVRPVKKAETQEQQLSEFETLLIETSPELRSEVVEIYLLEKVSSILGIPIDGIDKNIAFSELGLDSLLAVDMRNLLQRDLRSQDLPAMLIFAYPTVKELSLFISTQMAEYGSTESETYEENADNVDNNSDLDNISAEELQAMLEQELELMES